MSILCILNFLEEVFLRHWVYGNIRLSTYINVITQHWADLCINLESWSASWEVIHTVSSQSPVTVAIMHGVDRYFHSLTNHGRHWSVSPESPDTSAREGWNTAISQTISCLFRKPGICHDINNTANVIQQLLSYTKLGINLTRDWTLCSTPTADIYYIIDTAEMAQPSSEPTCLVPNGCSAAASCQW